MDDLSHVSMIVHLYGAIYHCRVGQLSMRWDLDSSVLFFIYCFLFTRVYDCMIMLRHTYPQILPITFRKQSRDQMIETKS